MKTFTDLKQSKKLAEILPIESADMRYSPLGDKMHPWVWTDTFIEKDAIPCWSLATLISVLPKNIKSPFGEINPFVGQVDVKDYRCVYLDGDWDSNVQTKADNPIDVCVDMIIKLHEQKLL